VEPVRALTLFAPRKGRIVDKTKVFELIMLGVKIVILAIEILILLR
jgi:hypothetical protein